MKTPLSSMSWNYEDTTVHLEKWPPGKKQQHYDDDGGEGCPVSAVVSQGNYEVTNGHLEKNKKISMMAGVRVVLSLKWCLRGTMKLQMANWKKKQENHDDDGGEGCPVSAVVSQGNYEVTNGHLEKKQKHHDYDGEEGSPVSAVVSQGNYEVTNGHLEKTEIS